MENNNVWEEIFECVQLEISEKAFNTWFKDTSLDIKGSSLTVTVANEFASDWVRKNYSVIIQNAAEKILNKKIEIMITSRKDEEALNTSTSI